MISIAVTSIVNQIIGRIQGINEGKEVDSSGKIKVQFIVSPEEIR